VAILFIHPDDDPEAGPWANQKWSRVIDLGLAGSDAYERWSRKFGCPVQSIYDTGNGFEVIQRVRDLVSGGLGKVTDSFGIDWWQIAVAYLYSQLETLVWLRRVVQGMGAGEDARVSRLGFHADALRQMLGGRLATFAQSTSSPRGVARYLAVARRLPAWQVAQILWDKYDPALEIRRRFARQPGIPDAAVVLLPSAYGNVTRTALDYAKTTPGLKFLLVAARRSAWTEDLPQNVRGEWLASYARRSEARHSEYAEILEKWTQLRTRIEAEPEIAILDRLGLMDDFPSRFRNGLTQRAAWESVFQHEEVQSVLCADDSNHWTLLPLLLARKFEVPTIACHHGALDVQRMFKQNAADVVLAKGAMEQDYLVRVCKVPASEVEVGGPGPAGNRNGAGSAVQRFKPLIAFFSEPYEVFSGRGEEFYRDLVPPLADLARQTGRKLVVKLHPAESRSERERIIRNLLSPQQRQVVSLVTGSTTPELLQQTWFGITVLSTVASECAVAGVPCFLCRWLEFTHYGYVDQFLRFGVGRELKEPSDIARIPQLLETYSVNPRIAADVWQPIDPGRLEKLLGARPASGRHVAMEVQRAQ
jgi:hypothetical protein